LAGCTSKKTSTDEKETIENHQEETKVYIEPFYRNSGAVIQQYNLDQAGLSKPVSLSEISDYLSDFDRNNVYSIIIDNGENINQLDGIELFPALEYLSIYKSKIKNIQELKNGHFSLHDLYIESSELEDVSDIVSLENMTGIYFVGSEKLKYFPDITNLNKLRSICLRGCKNINFNELAEKLPSGIQIIDLSDCGIESLSDIANLFKNNITRFNLSQNLIKEINFDMDYGSAAYIYMAGCPVSDNYFKWNEPASEKYPGYIRNLNDVIFAFGYVDDHMWVIEE
jgi:Leucine-rich repeat (LRR) protein